MEDTNVRTSLLERLETVLGRQEAALLMSSLPRSDPEDLLTRADLVPITDHLGGIDVRLDGIDVRLDGIDTRFVVFQADIDGRFEAMEGRFVGLEEKIVRVGTDVQLQLERSLRQMAMRIVLGVTFAMFATITGAVSLSVALT